MELGNFKKALERKTDVSYKLLLERFDSNFSGCSSLEELIDKRTTAGSVISNFCSWKKTKEGSPFWSKVQLSLAYMTDKATENYTTDNLNNQQSDPIYFKIELDRILATESEELVNEVLEREWTDHAQQVCYDLLNAARLGNDEHSHLYELKGNEPLKKFCYSLHQRGVSAEVAASFLQEKLRIKVIAETQRSCNMNFIYLVFKFREKPE